MEMEKEKGEGERGSRTLSRQSRIFLVLDSAIRKCFTKLLHLDSQELPQPIATDIVDLEIIGLQCPHLVRYYLIYDYGDRQSFHSAYHDKACFSLTIPFNPKDPSLLCIMNDGLIVGNARTKETQSAFSIPVPTPTSSSMPSLSTEQQKMVQVISALSEMNFQLSQKCLQDNEWNYARAGQVFTMLKTKGTIPEEAFKQIP
ncbi:Nuclear RNA export factor 2 [Pteropus alecto]|uniref:Nuclear RNA export factor 2 n=1 Tax=Pteropus alecto TaxID=9402 RepID=L5KNV8_PTEAL|nr:Nuclear RNA export factor 2 [Pteropus alecto]